MKALYDSTADTRAIRSVTSFPSESLGGADAAPSQIIEGCGVARHTAADDQIRRRVHVVLASRRRQNDRVRARLGSVVRLAPAAVPYLDIRDTPEMDDRARGRLSARANT